MSNQALESVIEELMDRSDSPKEFLEAVANVLQLKAAHLAVNWQDYNMSKAFKRAAAHVHKAAKELSP